MPEGPAGLPRPFVKDKRTIIILIGLAKPAPAQHIQADARDRVNRTINKILINRGAGIDIDRSTVELTVQQNPTNEQREALGHEISHVQQYDVKTEISEVSQSLVNRIHNTVVDEMSKMDFEIVGTKTTVA